MKGLSTLFRGIRSATLIFFALNGVFHAMRSCPCLAKLPEQGPVLLDQEGAGAPGPGQKKDPSFQAENREEDSYILQRGDRIRLKIYPEDEYFKGGEMEISSEGNITLPLAGKIPVAGKRVIEAERAVAQVLDSDFLVNPEAVIEVLEYKAKSVVVLGQVKKPGTYEFPPGVTRLTLLQAVSLAGGFSDIANIKKIRIVREVAGKKEAIQVNAENILSGRDPDIELKSGDFVHVSESLF